MLGHWGTDLVAATLDGHAIHPKALLRLFQKTAKAAGLPVIRLHDGRHTAATSALQAGVAIHIVKGRVGHANASTTLDVYAHFLPSADKLAADSAGSVLDLATSEGRAKGAKGGKRGATGSELTELDNTVRPYSPENKDITTQAKPNNSGSPGART